MGVDISLYLGPSIVVPELSNTVKSSLYCCSSVLCKNHNKAASAGDKFCPKCGSANQNKEISESIILNPYEEDTEFDYDHWYGLFENHNLDERIIYIPNFLLDSYDIFSVCDSEKYSEFDYDLSVVDFKANLDKFKDLPETKELMGLLTAFYPITDIVVSYRLFKYTC